MRNAIELARTDDGPVEIRLQGFVTAQERRVRRLRLSLELVLFGLVVLVSAVAFTIMLRWDYARTVLLQKEQQAAVLLQAERDCWRAAALRVPRSVDAEAWVGGCVSRVVSRGGS